MLDRQKHEIILRNLLRDIYSNSFLSVILGLKGGTACYLFYDLNRFSMDLDFNLLKIEEKEEVFKKIGTILNKYGNIIEGSIKRNTILFVLSYDKKGANIKIEISTRKFEDTCEIKSLLGLSVQVMQKSDMFAHKLIALSDRKKIANRDIFDIYWFFKNNTEINEKIILKRSGKDLVEYLEFLETFIQQKVNNKYILNGLGEILDEKNKLWVKNHLKEELIYTLKNFMLVLRKK
jgi:predicted nucleotidyltransferase component of viral defense system